MTPGVLGHGLTWCLAAIPFISSPMVRVQNASNAKGFSASSVDQDAAELVPTSDRPASCVPHAGTRANKGPDGSESGEEA